MHACTIEKPLDVVEQVAEVHKMHEDRAAGYRFIGKKLLPIIERMAADRDPDEFRPPDAESWYELHDVIR